MYINDRILLIIIIFISDSYYIQYFPLMLLNNTSLRVEGNLLE